MRNTLLLAFAIIFGLATQASAGLVFDQDPLELRPKPEDEQIETSFTFTNKGKNPIRVTGLDSTCSCLEASLDKAVYAPGEKGTGKATFKVSSFVGRHEKTLHIYTDDPAEPDKVLTVVLEVPEVVSIEPKLLEWVFGEEPRAKELTLKVVQAEPMKLKSVSATRENVTIETKEITPGREYRITVKPSATDVITVGMLKIEMDSKIPKFARQMAFFNIVRPELAEKKAKARAAEAGAKGEQQPCEGHWDRPPSSSWLRFWRLLGRITCIPRRQHGMRPRSRLRRTRSRWRSSRSAGRATCSGSMPGCGKSTKRPMSPGRCF
jgi:hypothetical protein